ncbi:MAG: hypothetical protein IJ013_09035, partial [Bacteroidaceae bacterium]|nr:hypothetical protein [Bacteroidaceae bacterium]
VSRKGVQSSLSKGKSFSPVRNFRFLQEERESPYEETEVPHQGNDSSPIGKREFPTREFSGNCRVLENKRLKALKERTKNI